MSVDVASNTQLKEKILSGVNKLAESVVCTLGPGGRNVLIQDADTTIRVTKDGVSVAKAFTKLKDPVENTAIQLMKTVSQKAVDNAGDGTTTATLLAQTIVNEGFKAIDDRSNPIQVKIGIDKAVQAVLAKLKTIAIDIDSEDQIMQVAQLSSNGDVEIAKLITQALDYVGDDGAVTIEESKSGETTLEKVEGMVFDRGFKTPYFITNEAKAECNLSKPLILVVNGRISASSQLLAVLNYAAKSDRSLLIIAEDVDGEALATLIVNKAKGIIRVCAVKAPDFGDRRTAILEDIATMCGATVISENKGINLAKIKESEVPVYLGEARIVTVTSKDTTIVEGKPKTITVEDGTDENGMPISKEVNTVEERLKQIKFQFDNAKSNFEKENLQSRIARLTGGVAIINVGGISEVEMKEKKDRVDDALHATKAAIMEGVVPGGGMALISCESSLNELQLTDKDQKIGVEIVRKALYAPFKRILNNAGIEDHFKVLAEIKTNAAEGVWSGYNVKTGEYCDFKATGVLDPAKVTRTALENAASVAGVLLTTTAAVYEIPEENSKQTDNNLMDQYQ